MRFRSRGLFWVAAWCVAGGATGGRAQDGPPVTSGHVDDAIERAVSWIKQQRKESGHWELAEDQADQFRGGDTGLALLALLYAGEDSRGEEMTRSLQWLAAQPLAATYTRALRAQVLALSSGETYRKSLADDAEWLQKAMYPPGTQLSGGYDYKSAEDHPTGGWCDNSNSQFGVLGLWMASEAGIDIPQEVWLTIRDYWTRLQNQDGGWSYQAGGSSTGSMSAAGLATLYVVLDRGYAADEGRFNGKSSAFCGEHRDAGGLIRAINSGLDWFGRYYAENPGGDQQWRYYYLYGLERTGRASGQKYFRSHDWFREGAAELLKAQSEAGHWSGSGGHMSDLRTTCFALMFLCHGRAPLLYNKLEHRGDWDTKMRDVAGLTRYAQGTLERLFNWQVVSLDSPIDELLEAPVLYVAGHAALAFDDVQVVKLREYCEHGGMIFAVACCSRPEFTQSVRELARKLYPDLPLRPVTISHPILSGEVQYPVKEPPELFEVHNGRRTLLLLSAQDVCAAWNQNLTRPWKEHFQLGVNVYLYATDKSPTRTRLETAEIPLESVDIQRTIEVARIRYAGTWDVEPFGWTRLGRYLNNKIATRLLVTSGVTFDSPALEAIRVAHITGPGAFELSDDEAAGLRRFLTGGGTLIADAAGGSAEFVASLERHVRAALKIEPTIVSDTSVLFTADGVEDAVRLSTFGYRRAARRDAAVAGAPRLKAFELGRRLAVIYSPLDVSIGLLGTPVYNCRGLDPDTCLRLMRNLILYGNLTSAEKARAASGAAGR